ncbi:MAG: diguanylate cyclase [Thioalkalispiraceae bacterium]|jgi:diguanylate cyclase (GGDEF)-like protein
MQVRLCDKYGFDKPARQRRLDVFGFTETDRSLGQLLHDEVIAQHGQQIVEQFYTFLLAQPETAVFISGTGQVERLKQTHLVYLETLGLGYEQELYFENRLEVGLAHERIGLPLSLYQSAYRLLQQLLISSLPDKLSEQDKNDLVQFIIKIAGLDMSLAMDTYHTVQVENLTSSIVRLRDSQQRLVTRVRHDTLTGAVSRDHVLEVLANEIALSARRAIPSCVAMIDLDHFKQINDSYGHLVGDQVLKGVVGRIRTRMRNLDVIGRYGGEEFLLVFPNTRLATATKIVERIRLHICDSPFHVDELSIMVTLSGGVTCIEKNDTIESLITRADDLMYQAKNKGRNRVEFSG